MAGGVDGANKLGPWGGSGGTAWIFEDAIAITKIKIGMGDVIDSLTFQYMDGATPRWSPRYGGAGGKSTEDGVVKVGPWGQLKPQHLKDIEGNPTQLIKIILRYIGCIQSIKFQYVADRVAKWSSTWGSESGSTAEIDLGTDNGLTEISGDYGNYEGYLVIRSLTFASTMGTYGPYGPKEGTVFSFPVKVGTVVAFFGRASQFLDALGFYSKPASV